MKAKEVLHVLQISRPTLARYVKDGKLKHIFMLGSLLVNKRKI